MAILISEKDFRAKQIIGNRQTLHNDKRINPLVRYNVPNKRVSKHMKQKLRANRTHRQIHIIFGDFNTPLSATDTTTSWHQQR